MRLKQNSSTAIVVRKSWANLEAIRGFLCGRPRSSEANAKGSVPPSGNGHGRVEAHGHPRSESLAGESGHDGLTIDDSYTIFARVLDDTDTRGLWIELHTKEHELDATVELQALMIPWPEVLAVVVADKFAAAKEEAGDEELEFSLTR